MDKYIRLLVIPALALGFLNLARATVETYVIDSVHSSVGFTIRHMVSKVPGNFTQFSGQIMLDREDFEKSSVEASVELSSVDTRNEKRNGHLQSPDFLDVAKYTTATFKSKTWQKTGEDKYAVTGDLNLHGVTKEVLLEVTLLGFGPGMKPNSRLSGWEATTKINKSDFGISGPAILGTVLGDEVTINITIEACMKP